MDYFSGHGLHTANQTRSHNRHNKNSVKQMTRQMVTKFAHCKHPKIIGYNFNLEQLNLPLCVYIICFSALKSEMNEMRVERKKNCQRMS